MNAKQARDEAIARVEEHASDEWKAQALEVIHVVAQVHKELTTDTIWWYLEVPSEPRALGAVMMTAKRLQWIEPTDRTEVSKREACHARPLRIWKSLLK